MTDSTPEVESAGQETPVSDVAPEASDLDSVLERTIEEHFTEEPQGPERDERGRFTSKEGQETPEEEAPPEAEDAPETASDDAEDEASATEGDDQQEEPEDSTEPPLDAPQHWSAVDKEKFGQMPREAQEWAIERDRAMTADYTAKTQELAAQRQAHEPLNRVLEQVRPNLQRAGVSDDQYISRLIDADRRLQTDPAGAIKWLAANAGLDLSTLEYVGGDVPDPQIAALQQRIQGLEGHLTQAEQRIQEERQAETQGRIDSFAVEKDADGNLKYPHFERLRNSMGQLIQAGTASDLSDAYDKAIRLDDGLYREALEAERKKVAAAEDKRRKEALEKGRKVPAKRSANPPGGASQATDLDSILDNTLSGAGYD